MSSLSTTPAAVALVNLGCPKNLVDAEKMLGSLAEAGFQVGAEPEDADLVIVNTCGFIESAKRESIHAILDAAKLKKRKRAPKLLVAGCLSQRHGAELMADIPEIDGLIGVADRDEAVKAARRLFLPGGGDAPRTPFLERVDFRRSADTGRMRLTPRHYAYLRISDGCSRPCAFCAIPAIRGKLRSKTIATVLTEARELVADGAKELNLVAQDSTAYGTDLPAGERTTLAKLLHELEGVEGLRWIRLLYAYPSAVTEELIAETARNPKVVPYVDMPVQHGSDAVLAAMRRQTTRGDILGILRDWRAAVPGLVFRTTVIAGMPGEGEAEFAELLSFLEEAGPERLGCFPYSPEEGTPAARMDGQVSEAMKRKRRAAVMAAQQKRLAAIQKGWVGQKTEALLESRLPAGIWKARTWHDAPEVDGTCFVEGVAAGASPGDLLDVTLTGQSGYDLKAAVAP